ncbi:hypothetical protein LIA77_11024 [Sarocladium implicatum]|nr:hypothetical protein LIA77_11024 [Sarocladium implicatum]
MSSSNTSSSPAEKHTRRGGTGPHVLRAGGGPGSASTPSSKRTTAPSSAMPAPPPKVVMTSAVASSGVPDDGQDKESTRSRSGSIRSKDMSSTGSSSAPSEAATALLIRERDDRIASLERELQIMEHEFHRELDKLAKSESETATFWQAKHSAQHQQFLRADTDLRLLRAEVEAREHERDELRNGFEVLRRSLAERDSEARGLRQQVRGLKEFVSTSTRTDGQQTATDESLGESMALLANGLQNWVITNFRRAKLRPIEELDEAARAEASELLPMFEELLMGGKKVHLLQSIVSRVLVEYIFGAYYAGLSSDQTVKFRDMEAMLGSFATSDEVVNQWRASTLALIHREAQDRLSEETSTLLDTLTSRILRILDSILLPIANANISTNSTNPYDARDTSLRALLTSALDLSRLLSVQRAVLRVYMPQILPHQRVLFDPEVMEDVGGEDEDALDQREIACVVFPGLIKNGDESGGHLQVYRNVVTKARVLCGEEG